MNARPVTPDISHWHKHQVSKSVQTCHDCRMLVSTRHMNYGVFSDPEFVWQVLGETAFTKREDSPRLCKKNGETASVNRRNIVYDTIPFHCPPSFWRERQVTVSQQTWNIFVVRRHLGFQTISMGHYIAYYI